MTLSSTFSRLFWFIHPSRSRREKGGDFMEQKQSEIEAKAQKEADRERLVNRIIAIISLLVSIMALAMRVWK